jgi:DNA-binding NarL/FixJ family response regulator
MTINDMRATTTKVFVFGCDRLSQAGMVAYLRDCPGIEPVLESGLDEAEVALVVADTVDEAAINVLRAVQRAGCPKVVLVVGEVDVAGVAEAVEVGVVGILRRSTVTPEVLQTAIAAACAGDGMLPPDLLGGLMRQVQVVQTGVLAPRGLGFSGLNDRELAVLRLLSEGSDTREIAQRLAYSERTVKTVIQDVTRRLGLRNRSHAVAYALRQGLI